MMRPFPSWWLKKNVLSLLLLPLAGGFYLLSTLRRIAYQRGWLSVYRPALPVIIVGNLTVGGTGKTPMVLALVAYLKQLGLQPVILLRGYGGQAKHYPLSLTPETPISASGDEAALLFARSGVPVVVDPQRARAAAFIAAQKLGEVIVCDDGLQHYALARDLTLVVVDKARGWGNGYLLPAGMLREPLSRLAVVDGLICQTQTGDITLSKRPAHLPCFALQGRLCNVYALNAPLKRLKIADFSGQTVYAVAGIGQPERFFALLRAQGILVIAKSFPDHHPYTIADFAFATKEAYPILMTEKDAVKCRGFALEAWVCPMEATLSADFYPWFHQRLLSLGLGSKSLNIPS